MDERLVIIDLHCDPTMPAGAKEAGGGNVYMRQLLQCLGSTDLRVTYITRKKYQELDYFSIFYDKIDFFRLELGDWGPDDKSILQNHYGDAICQIRNILNQYGNCSLVFHSSYWQSGKLALALSGEYNTYFVHTVLSNALRKQLRGGINDDPPERITWEKEVFSNAKYVLCSSESEAKDIEILYGIPSKNILITGLLADPSFSRADYDLYGSVALDDTLGYVATTNNQIKLKTCIDNETFEWWTSKSFVYFGRLHPDKGLEHIISAWALLYETLGNKTPPLWIVGGTLEGIQICRAKIKERWKDICEWELKHLIVWWGTLSPSSISTLLLRASAVITHSRYESAGLVILEAMTRGIPVLATPYGYGHDLVRNWYNGFQVPYGDTQSLFFRLLMFYSQPYLSHLMGCNARVTAHFAEENFRFFEKHLFAYGYRTECGPDYQSLNLTYSPEDLTAQKLDTFPFLITSLSRERLKTIFTQVFDSDLIGLDFIEVPYLAHYIAKTSAHEMYVVCYLSAHINPEFLWNRFIQSPNVTTVNEQIETIEQFARNSGLFQLEWSSSREGIVILSMPKLNYQEVDVVWSVASNSPVHVDCIASRLESIRLFIQNTPGFEYLLQEIEFHSTEYKRAISIEQDLPVIQYIPQTNSRLENVAALNFESARYISLPGFIHDVGVHTDQLQSFLDCFNPRALSEAKSAWENLSAVWNKCKKIVLQL